MKKLFLVILYCSYFLFGGLFCSNLWQAHSEEEKYITNECDDVTRFSPLDRCRNNVAFKNGQCDFMFNMFTDKDFAFFPFTSNDYNYDPRNPYCSIMGASFAMGVFVAENVMKGACLMYVPKVEPKSIISATKFIKMGVAGLEKLLVLGKPIPYLFLDPVYVLQADVAIATIAPGIRCATDIAAIPGACAGTAALGCGPAVSKASACCGGIGVFVTASETLLLGYTAIVHQVALESLNNTQVCGYDWTVWGFNKTDNELDNYSVKGTFENSYKYKVTKCILEPNENICGEFQNICEEGFCTISKDNESTTLQASDMNINNRIYREYLYNGKEYKNPDMSDGTIDPRLPETKGYAGLEQRYYLRGNDAGNYACSRFDYGGQGCVVEGGIEYRAPLTRQQYQKCKEVFQKATLKCRQASNTSICLQYKNSHAFCQRSISSSLVSNTLGSGGRRCKLGSVIFEAYNSVKEPSRKVCARSYSVCPYNFNVAGGTEKEQLYCDGRYTDPNTCQGEDKQKIWKVFPTGSTAGVMKSSYGQTKNFCQYNAHCTYLPTEAYIYRSTNLSKFLDPACKNFVGDSRNIMNLSVASGDTAFTQIRGELARTREVITIEIAQITTLLNIRPIQLHYNTAISLPIIKDLVSQLDYFDIVVLNTNLTEPMPSTQDEWIAIWKKILAGDYTNEIEENIKKNWPDIKSHWQTINGVANYTKGQTLEAIVTNSVVDIGKYRGFTAPIAQCVKESIYNMFNNIAGISRCTDDTLKINDYGLCGDDTPSDYNPDYYTEANPNDEYYMIGDKLPERENIFFKIQQRVRGIIKIVAMLSIMFIAFNVLIKGDYSFIEADPRSGSNEKIRAMLFYLFKFALVYYFAVGTAWQSFFYKGVINASELLYYKAFEFANNYQSLLVTEDVDEWTFRLVEEVGIAGEVVIEEVENDCLEQNQRVPLADCRQNTFNLETLKTKKNALENLNPNKKYVIKEHIFIGKKLTWNPKYDGCYFSSDEYPEGKEYLAIFDMLDCKLAKYFDYGPDINIPNIILFLVATLLLSVVGVFIAIVTFFFFIVILSIAIKALYIFLISFIAINLLIFLSPLIFPMLLFKRTKGIFDSWLSQLMGFVLQPVILMAFLGLYLAVFDKIALGSATYIHSPNRGVSILNCVDVNGKRVTDSIVCLFHIDKTTPVTNLFGPFLLIGQNAQVYGPQTIWDGRGILMILLSFAIIALIFNNLMDKITGIAANLVGGAELKGGMSVKDFTMKALGVAKALGWQGMPGKRHLAELRKGIEEGRVTTRKGEEKTEAPKPPRPDTVVSEGTKEGARPDVVSGESEGSKGIPGGDMLRKNEPK